MPQAPCVGVYVAQLSLLNVDVSNHLYRGDCLSVLDLVPDNSIDLIYIDPPFYSQRYYETFWGEDAERYAFEDRWKGGIETYLSYLVERVRKMYGKLKSTGSFYLHLDYHICHYMKIELDRIFGYANFQNEIIWRRTRGHNDATLTRFGAVHDTLLFYSKGESHVFNKIRTERNPNNPKTHDLYRHTDGKLYRKGDCRAPGNRGPRYVWNGHNQHWRFTREESKRLEAEGRIVYSKSGMPRVLRPVDLTKGAWLQDVWIDIDPPNSGSAETVGYPTQKPLALLKRIILSSSNVGDVVLDAFCGCGTTLEAAQLLSRRWIGIDISQTAIRVIQNRLRKIGAPPTQIHGMVESVDDLQKLDWREFQNWAVDAIQGRHSPRKIADMGIDGFTFMENHPIQVKQIDGVGRPVVDSFVGVLQRQKDKRGIIIALDFTKGAQAEVARLKREAGIEIELISCKRLLREEIPYRQLA